MASFYVQKQQPLCRVYHTNLLLVVGLSLLRKLQLGKTLFHAFFLSVASPCSCV